MGRSVSLKRVLCVAIAVVWALGGPASAAEPLRLVTEISFGPYEHLNDDKAPGFSVEVLRQVFAAMGQEVSFEAFPANRSWMMIARGERDGIFTAARIGARGVICSFPDEPLRQEKWVFFVRTADVGKLAFSSFDDLVGHDIAIRVPTAGLAELPIVSRELWEFLREHDNMVETSGNIEGLRMLAAGRVDYAVLNLSSGKQNIAAMGLSGKIEPLLSRSVIEGGMYVCFSKTRVSPALIDAFSQALKQFKQTEAFQAIYQKYFP